MKANKIINLVSTFLAIAGLFSICHAQQLLVRILRNMKAEQYFSEPQQIELARAVSKDDIKAVDNAIDKGADVNKIGKEEMTPLAWAFAKQNKASFQRLLEKGADPNFMTSKVAWNNEGQSVMQFAALSEDSDYLRLALQYGGNPNAPDSLPGRTIIYTAIRNNRPENIKILAKNGGHINYKDNTGFTPLMYSVFNTKYDIAYLILKLGANPEIKTPRGQTIADIISENQDRSIQVLGKEKEQREWYNKVVAELKNQGLM